MLDIFCGQLLHKVKYRDVLLVEFYDWYVEIHILKVYILFI
jgi:hypothetical protein